MRVEAVAGFPEALVGGVVDVDQEEVVGPGGWAAQAFEHVVLDRLKARIGHQFLAERDDATCDPLDDALNQLDHLDTRDTVRVERCFARVTEAEAADHDIEIAAAVHRDRACCQLALGHGDRAAHQELMLECQLDDVRHRRSSPTEDEHAERRIDVIDDFEFAHRDDTACTTYSGRGRMNRHRND